MRYRCSQSPRSLPGSALLAPGRRWRGPPTRCRIFVTWRCSLYVVHCVSLLPFPLLVLEFGTFRARYSNPASGCVTAKSGKRRWRETRSTATLLQLRQEGGRTAVHLTIITLPQLRHTTRRLQPLVRSYRRRQARPAAYLSALILIVEGQARRGEASTRIWTAAGQASKGSGNTGMPWARQ